MKNLTITLPDETAAQVRVAAAKAGKSMSCYIVDLLTRQDDFRAEKIVAMETFLSAPSVPISDENGRPPSREELYRRDVLRGHDHPDLHVGRQQPGESVASKASDRRTRATRRDHHQSSSSN